MGFCMDWHWWVGRGSGLVRFKLNISVQIIVKNDLDRCREWVEVGCRFGWVSEGRNLSVKLKLNVSVQTIVKNYLDGWVMCGGVVPVQNNCTGCIKNQVFFFNLIFSHHFPSNQGK